MERPLLTLLFLASFVCGSVSAQTNPAAQPLPYEQNFDALPSSAVVYPAGWQGWLLSGAPSGSFNTAAPASDKPLISGGSASSTANGVYNYAGKLGFLNSGSADNALVLSISTSGQQNVQLSYDAMTIRNPYDGNSNTRINEVVVQYRIGVAGTFTSINETAYQNDTIQQTGSGVTLPQHLVNRSVILPPDCNNQAVVQLRWVNRQISGAGSRPGFAIDNIAASGSGRDTTPPVISLLTPVNAAADVSPVTSPEIIFSENIKAGNGYIRLHNSNSGLTDSFPVTGSAIIINNNVLTLKQILQPHSHYYITLDSGTVKDLSDNDFAGITDTTQWNFTTGNQELNYNFNDCTPIGSSQLSGGFTQYSVTGAQLWGCTNFGQQSSNGVQINGYSGGAVENEDWLISPAFDLTGLQFPLLQFSSRTAFAGPALSLRISTNYTGSGDPRNATWTTLNGRFPETGSDVWTLSSGINLAAYKQTGVYIAFVYTSGPAVQASRWTIDDFRLTDTTASPAPTLNSSPAAIDFDYVKSGQTSEAQRVGFWANDFTGDLKIKAPAGFKVSGDSSNYSNEVTFSVAALATGPQQVFVKFAPTAADQPYSGNLTFSSPGFSGRSITLSGTSLRSLKVVNWNIEWFGSPAQNPANDSLQQANVTTILKKLDADIFALAEVVDTARFRAVVSQLPGYSYVLSDFGSYADSITDVDYVSAQKLAFVYKTAVIRKISTYGILRQGGSSNAYYNWSSGRFPYEMEATAKLGNDSARIRFILLHAKANTGTKPEKITSWNRRKDGLKELKDTLDLQYPYSNIIMLGDFNDDLSKTITTELLPDTTTSYIDFIRDSINYRPLTLPLSLSGQRSTVSYSSVIDNVISSNEVGVAYLPASARIQTQVAGLVSSYGTTTTDHYPVLSRYNLHILGNPLPVEDFDARADGGKVLVSWHTPYEINSSRFVIERSRNLRTYEAVDTVAAHGSKAEGSDYISYDEQPWPGFSAYRLKTLGLDSSVRYSPVKMVLVTDKDFWRKLLWCIFGHQLQYWLDWPRSGDANIELMDVQGRVRYQGRTALIKGRNYRTIAIDQLPAGIYFLRVQSGELVQVTKILINQ
ncbi:Por secretion system C-terminal sorting domain-containing protein [Chitinophaga ginsengisegetis]|uniref:Por secretion system C-terminal sorting domain-containing protein n=1 Tax=Chitinophaga ginsengisegetis TaxID=393003 RepID=A0A1T5NLP6_9BACT|nr:choice-of-anchor J domain-containing protein [Chitinophaga ginsengisegetis]SKD01550.1 Por secretion system C-terminal sorting domain-containing protein [Chitinophaga ginsengisegetis]